MVLFDVTEPPKGKLTRKELAVFSATVYLQLIAIILKYSKFSKIMFLERQRQKQREKQTHGKMGKVVRIVQDYHIKFAHFFVRTRSPSFS